MRKTREKVPRIRNLFDKGNMMKTVAVCTIKRADSCTTKGQAADERIANEDAKRVKLAAGELGIDIYNMRPALVEAGFHYVETLDDLGEFNGIDCRNRD